MKMTKIKIVCVECGRELENMKDSRFARKVMQNAVCRHCVVKLRNGGVDGM
jgi:NMD protein affecting ribosome stability and mRNA decay